jgi:hypothetical protein
MNQIIFYILCNWAIQGLCIWILLRKAQEK